MQIQKCAVCSGLPLLISLAAVTLLGGCEDPNSVEVRSHYGSGIKFDGIGSTWDWLPDEYNPRVEEKRKNLHIAELIHDSIAAHLSTAGFRQTTTDTPDFYLNYIIGFRAQTYAGGSPHGVEYEKGSLVIDVIDPKTRQLIWRGIAQAKLDDTMEPEARRARIDLALQEIVTKFPSQDRGPPADPPSAMYSPDANRGKVDASVQAENSA